ncbi:MAG TPA: pitrilysin family protein [Xanthomonadaceae bacterium]|nr:pitrilysin family protein [Xanthomonadaceae bacterium]
MPKPPATTTTVAPASDASSMPAAIATPAKPGTAGKTDTTAAAPAKSAATKTVPATSAATIERVVHTTEPLPKDLPAYGKERSLPALKIEQRKLANGLTVWVLPREDGPPKVRYVLAIRGGLAADPPRQPGFSSMLADLLKEGTASRDALRVAQDLQSYGGDLQTEAGVDGITLTMSGLASNAAKTITLLSEIAMQPAFPQREVELGKLNAVAALLASEADPDYQARRAMGRLVFAGHPYGRVLPTQASILSITPDMLHAEHGSRFRPDQALLVITGRIAPDMAFQLAESVFGDWRAEGRPLDATPRAPTEVAPGHVFVARDDSVQSAIRIGRPVIAADSPDYFPLLLTNAVLGGGFRSRLNQNLREDKGYTYGAGSGFRAERAGGAVVAYANVRNEVTGAALAQFIREFSLLGSKPVSDDELAQTKHYLAGGYLLFKQQQAQVAAALADYWLVGLPPQTLSDYVPKLQAVTATQVQAMARKYFAPKDQSIVVVGVADVKSQLAPFGAFEQQSQ